MPSIDKRFALMRNDEPWYAALIGGPTSPAVATFRISGNGTRDAKGAADRSTDLDDVVHAVLKEGRRARFAPDGGPASSLYLHSDGVTGWRLDAAVAARLGLPTSGTAR